MLLKKEISLIENTVEELYRLQILQELKEAQLLDYLLNTLYQFCLANWRFAMVNLFYS